MTDALRPATLDDAATCARIVNDWIDDRAWMPRVHSHADVRGFYRDFVLPNRQVWVAGAPVAGFVALDESGQMVTALYVSHPGQGLGKRLLDHAKQGRRRLQLWTFVANAGARRFYAREGFVQVRQPAGENEEGLPDILYEWCAPAQAVQ